MSGVQAQSGATKLQLPKESDRRSTVANSLSPVGNSKNQDRWWANNVAANLQKALSNDGSPLEGSNEQTTISALTKEIAKHVVASVPDDVLNSLINEARSLMKIIETSCSDQLREGSEDGDSDDPNENSSSANQQMAKIVNKKIPHEMSKWIAKEIHVRLLAAGEDISSTEEDDDDENDIPVDIWRSARGSFDVRNEALLAKKLAEAGGLPDENPWTSPIEINASEAITPVHAMDLNGSDHAKDGRVHVTDDMKQRSQAFRKFKQVLGGGTGFRVIKHNHGGGRKTRVLKYNASKNRLHWESSRMLGGEQISCSRIVKVHREITVVYVWYMTGGRHGSVKKMVGFETQREADAQILELALLYLKDHGSHTNRG
jgi:hypothetical protein